MSGEKKKCKGCRFPKYGSSVGIIWLSSDGYCSVCNVRMRDRERKIIGMDKFVETKITYTPEDYPHLNNDGYKLTNRNVLLHKIRMKNRMMNVPSEYKKALNKGVKKITDF